MGPSLRVLGRSLTGGNDVSSWFGAHETGKGSLCGAVVSFAKIVVVSPATGVDARGGVIMGFLVKRGGFRDVIAVGTKRLYCAQGW